MDFKSLINKIDTLETPTKTASTGKTSNVQSTPVTLTESAQLRVLSGASTVAHETALMESAKQDKYFPPAKGDKKSETKPKRKSMDTKTNESNDGDTAPNKSNVSKYGGPVVSKKSDQSQWFTSAKSNKKEDDSAESKPKRKSSFPPAKDDDSAESKPKRKSSFPPAKDDDSAESKPKRKSSFPPAKDDDSAESKPKRKSSFPPAKDDDSAESKPKRKSSFPPAKDDKSPNDSSRSSKSNNATKVPVSKYGKSSESDRKDESVTSFTSRFLQMVESKKAGADNKQAKTLKSQAAQIEKLKKQIEKLKEKPVTETTRSTKRNKTATLESRLRSATLKSRINESDDSVYDKSATYKFLQKFISEVGKTLGHPGLVDWDFNRDGSIKIKMNPDYFNLSDKSDQSDSAKASRMLDTIVDKYFRSFRQNGDYFDQPVGGEFSVGIKTGSTGQYESKRNRGSRLAEGRDYSGRQLSFKEMIKLVQESGGQQRIDPVDVELFQWANRVAVNKLGEGTKAEVYAGMVYENMGGIFEMYDVLSESGHFDDEDETYMDPISGRMHPNDRFSSNRVSAHEVKEIAKIYDSLGMTEYEFEDEIENLAGRNMSRECRDYIERNITLSEFIKLVTGDDEFDDRESDDIGDHSFGGNDFGDDFDDGFDSDRSRRF